MDTFNVSSIVAFLILFLGLYCFVFFSIIVYNIYRKSYRPQETVIVLLSLIALFIVNAVFLLLSISSVVEGVTQRLEQNFDNRPNQAVLPSGESLFRN